MQMGVAAEGAGRGASSSRVGGNVSSHNGAEESKGRVRRGGELGWQAGRAMTKKWLDWLDWLKACRLATTSWARNGRKARLEAWCNSRLCSACRSECSSGRGEGRGWCRVGEKSWREEWQCVNEFEGVAEAQHSGRRHVAAGEEVWDRHSRVRTVASGSGRWSVVSGQYRTVLVSQYSPGQWSVSQSGCAKRRHAGCTSRVYTVGGERRAAHSDQVPKTRKRHSSRVVAREARV